MGWNWNNRSKAFMTDWKKSVKAKVRPDLEEGSANIQNSPTFIHDLRLPLNTIPEDRKESLVSNSEKKEDDCVDLEQGAKVPESGEVKSFESPRKKVAQGSHVKGRRELKRKLATTHLAIFTVICFFGLGVVTFSQLEGWSALDSFYYVAITLTTVGYGDFSPSTDAGMLLACIFILFGLAIIATMLGMVAESLFEKAKAASAENTELEKSPYHTTIVAAFLAICSIFLGFIFYGALKPEGITWIEALYFSVVTCTTVGYGDILPVTPGGKVFAIFWTIIGTITTGNFLGSFMSNYVEVQQAKKRHQELKKTLSKDEIKEVDEDGDGKISVSEFVLYKIEKMGLVSADDINVIAEEFSKFDKDGDGLMDSSVNVLRRFSQSRQPSEPQTPVIPSLDDVQTVQKEEV
mmetsp:Transcript_27524/g.34404  ORF Transcript_27524/g.34404 Transcript_27524/m.34404 type:complete len:406 (+) Transcript_27524:82-1299(+)